MAPKNIGPKPMSRAEKKKFKTRNGMVISEKTVWNPKEALKAKAVEVLKKPATPKHVAGGSVTRDSKGRRVAADPEFNKCDKCYGTGVAEYNAWTKKEKPCKPCKGLGWVQA